MNRKNFLSSIIGAGLLGRDVHTVSAAMPEKIQIPPSLKPGDTIGISSPAGYISSDGIEPAVSLMKSWGFKIKTGTSIGHREYTLGGTDEVRRRDFQAMLDDDSLAAIMCARGGYGVIRIIDTLDFGNFKKRPKWIIGFSDITILHAHLFSQVGCASLHSKMCNSFPTQWHQADEDQKNTIISIRDALTGIRSKHEIAPSPFNKTGTATGRLVGGNLRVLENLAGTSSDLNTDGCILFIEDTGEYLYSIDRMLWNLKRTGKLNKLQGLIVGGFRIKPDDPGEEFGMPLQQIVLDKVKEFAYPVLFNFPVGHQKNNFALKCGAVYCLTVGLTSAFFEETNEI